MFSSFFSEEIVNDVKAHTLNIETKETPSEEKENNSQKVSIINDLFGNVCSP